MSVDFDALVAGFVSGLPDVRACVLVSGDGLTLSSHPKVGVNDGLDIWGRLAGLGHVERGFVAMSDQIWVFCRRGPYGALAVTGLSTTPGIALDGLERMLLAAEESRVRREGVFAAPAREPARIDPPWKLRPALHRDPKPAVEEDLPVVITSDEILAAAAAAETVAARAAGAGPAWADQRAGGDSEGEVPIDIPEHEPVSMDVPEHEAASIDVPDPEADTSALSKEFSGLFREEEG